ncbi:hypothetical protein [Cellulomonas sp. RIT-PI-Y]|uniref:hypothetical protein n=1 Tax=Cellulomonas sp. RIT-PI-Y TaxID=3035297 RepID=UPI0021DAB513|nr:hypothetical protein [Cellulomonas sp. RIT-PI-Y]
MRISASSRGVRTSIGTNTARVSFGGGRTYTSMKVAGVRVSQNTYSSGRTSTRVSAAGFSTGAGSSAGHRPTERRPSLAQLERAAQAEEVTQIERQLTSLHLEQFPAAVPEPIPAPEPTDVDVVAKEYQRAAVKGIAFYRPGQRRAAKERARAEAVSQAARVDADNLRIYREWLAAAAADFQRLVEHDPTTVISAVDTAFADNASESTCVDAGIEQDGTRYTTVVIVFDSADLIPEKAAVLTPAGKPTLKKRTKTDRNALYVRALASTVLATVREALMTSPSTDEVRVVVLRRDRRAAGPERRVEPIYAATFERGPLEQVRPALVDLDHILTQIPDARFVRRGVTAEVMPLGTDDDDELRQLAAQFTRALTAS